MKTKYFSKSKPKKGRKMRSKGKKVVRRPLLRMKELQGTLSKYIGMHMVKDPNDYKLWFENADEKIIKFIDLSDDAEQFIELDNKEILKNIRRNVSPLTKLFREIEKKDNVVKRVATYLVGGDTKDKIVSVTGYGVYLCYNIVKLYIYLKEEKRKNPVPVVAPAMGGVYGLKPEDWENMLSPGSIDIIDAFLEETKEMFNKVMKILYFLIDAEIQEDAGIIPKKYMNIEREKNHSEYGKINSKYNKIISKFSTLVVSSAAPVVGPAIGGFGAGVPKGKGPAPAAPVVGPAIGGFGAGVPKGKGPAPAAPAVGPAIGGFGAGVPKGKGPAPAAPAVGGFAFGPGGFLGPAPAAGPAVGGFGAEVPKGKGPAPAINPFDSIIRRKKEIVNLVLEEIRNNGGRDDMYRFKDAGGRFGLRNIALKPTSSASGTYIGSAQVVYNGEIVDVFIKMIVSDELSRVNNPSYSLLTEACIYNEINQNRYSNIPTLINSYGVLYSTKLVNDFYGKIDFNLPTQQYVSLNYKANKDFRPIYFISEINNEFGTSEELYKFISKIPRVPGKSYIYSLFFEDASGNPNRLRKNVYSVFVQLIITMKLMHDAGLYHNDPHGGNIYVVKLNTPVEFTLGNIKMKTDHIIRVYDWDRGFSDQCNPLTNSSDPGKFINACQSIGKPANIIVNRCYSPHEDFAMGDSWFALYNFIRGDGVGDIDTINNRAIQLINLLTNNFNYTGKFWSTFPGINYNNLIAKLNIDYLSQIRS
jgi:hypothetical protein